MKTQSKKLLIYDMYYASIPFFAHNKLETIFQKSQNSGLVKSIRIRRTPLQSCKFANNRLEPLTQGQAPERINIVDNIDQT